MVYSDFAFSLLISLCIFLALHISLASAKRCTYIVHMDKSTMPMIFSTPHHWYSSAIDSIKIPGPSSPLETHHFEPKHLYTYDNAFHGFSAVMSEDELESLKKLPGFISARKDFSLTHETTHTPDFLSLSSATGIWPASDYGSDGIIGVVDSGVWPESPSFKDNGMTEVPKRWKGICQEGQQWNSSLCNRKLIGARYFNKGFLAGDPTRDLGINSTRDDDGHGTHVASTAAGNYVKGASYFGYAVGTARGVAPRARLAIYKVSWSGLVASDCIAAVDQAVADGVDVLSISLSFGSSELYDDPFATAAFGAMEKGVLVNIAAANRGPGRGTVRNAYPWAFVVASGSTDRWFAGTLTLGNGLKITGWTTFPAKAIIRNLSLIYNRTISSCSSSELLSEVSDGGAIIICESSEDNSFSDQIRVVSQSKVPAAIFISTELGIYRSNFFPHPGVVITPQEGKKVINYARNGANPQASIAFQQTLFGRKPAPAVSPSSSRGPARSYSGILKPDIMAPGILILAAYSPISSSSQIGSNIQLSSEFNIVSGTSMATPHVAGIAAMLKAIHPEWSPSAIRSAIMTTASNLDNTNSPIKDIDANYEVALPIATGAGHVDPNRAADPGLIYDATPQDYVNHLCSLNFTRSQFLTIVRSAKYKCSNPSPDLNYPSFIALYEVGDDASKKFVQKFQRIVTNVGNGAAKYRAKLVVPKGTSVSVSPNTLVFSKKYEKKSYSLTIRYTGSEDQEIPFGSLSWVEDNGKHIVRSPIVVAPRLTFETT